MYEHKAEFKNYNELAFQLQIQLFGLLIENGSEPFKYCPSANKLGEKLRQEKAQGTQQGKEGPGVPAQKSLLLLSVLFSPVSISYSRSFFSSPCNDRFSRARLLPVCKAHFWRFCLQISPVRCFCQECRFPMKFYQQLFCRLRPFDLFCNIGFSTNLSSSEDASSSHDIFYSFFFSFFYYYAGIKLRAKCMGGKGFTSKPDTKPSLPTS